jgi:hypothetical protein
MAEKESINYSQNNKNRENKHLPVIRMNFACKKPQVVTSIVNLFVYKIINEIFARHTMY